MKHVHKLLKSHRAIGAVALAALLTQQPLEGAEKMIASDKKEGPFSLEIEYLKSDIVASNGMIHVIGQVLIPETKPSKPLSPSELIELVIDRGVPVFIDGKVAECAAIYEITVEALRGQDAVPEKSRIVLTHAIMAARTETSARKPAWILREAIDETWKNLHQTTQ